MRSVPRGAPRRSPACRPNGAAWAIGALRAPRRSAVRAARRDTGDRLAHDAVEQEELSALRRLQQRRDGAAVTVGQVDERRLRRNVVIPDVVMHRLHGPARATRFDIERRDRGAVSVGCGIATHAEVVGCLVAERHVHEAERVVVSRRRPHVRRAARIVAAAGGSRVTRGLPMSHAQPARPSGGRWPGSHPKANALASYRPRSPHDDPIACDNGCGRLEIEPRLDGSHALLEIDDAASAEIRARLTGRGVEGDQTRVDRWNEDPARAIRGGRPLARRVRQLVVAETAAARPGGRFDPTS